MALGFRRCLPFVRRRIRLSALTGFAVASEGESGRVSLFARVVSRQRLAQSGHGDLLWGRSDCQVVELQVENPLRPGALRRVVSMACHEFSAETGPAQT